MKYEWAAVFRRETRIELDDGHSNMVENITKRGEIQTQYGQDVLSAIVEQYKNLGNLIQFEMREL